MFDTIAASIVLIIDPKDIAQQDLDQLLALLWVIICHYHLSTQVILHSYTYMYMTLY